MGLMPRSHGRRALRSAVLVVGSFVAFAWLIVAGLAWRDYRSIRERSEAETRLAAASIQNHLGTLLNATEQIANGIARTYQERGDGLRYDEAYHRHLGTILLDFSRDLVSISLVDVIGRVVATSAQFPPPERTLLHDQDYFSAFLRGYADVFVSPISTGRISGQPVFNIAYPINSGSPDEYRFGGVVVISVRPSVVIRTLDDAGLQSRVNLVILNQLKKPVLSIENGELIANEDRAFSPSRDMGEKTGILRHTAATSDGRDVWIKLSPEISARITISDRELLSLWRRNMAENSLVAVLLTAFALVMIRHMRRLIHLLNREHLRRTISEDNLRFRVADLEATRHDLEKARKAAEKANAAKTDFLAAMSHEIRTPMNGILGFIDLLRRGPLDEQQKSYMRRVVDASKSLQAILDEILDFSKIEAGHVRISSEPFDLYELVDGVVEWARAQITRNGLVIEKHIREGIPRFIVGDAHRLRQVLINLVSNALKFTQKGHIVIDVRETVRGPEMIELHFTVSDTGSGIAADDQATLFKPFFQIDRPTQRARGGTGLGLAICRQLIEIQGGRIGVTSEPGKGSDFWFNLEFQLPVQIGPFATTARMPEMSTLAQATRVLVVDDVAMNRELLAAILEGAGFDVTEAESGSRALALAKGTVFDLVLMDIMMPEIDGIETTARLRRIAGWSHVPIIGLSASVMPDQIQIYLNSGLDGFVPKPVDADRLIMTLRDILNRREAKRAL